MEYLRWRNVQRGAVMASGHCRALTNVQQAGRSGWRHDEMRVELRRGRDGERGPHHVVGSAYGADVSGEARVLVLRGG